MNAKNAYEFTAKLAFPRLVGSEGELKAQALLNEELENIGNPHITEEVRASMFSINLLFRVTMPIGALFLLIAFLFSEPLIGLNNPIISLIFSIVGMVWLLSSTSIIDRSFGYVPNFMKVYKTNNFIAEITPPNPKAHLIYMAHYDSKSQVFPVMLRVGLFVGGLLTGIIYALEIFVGSIITLSGGSPAGFWSPSWIFFLVVFLLNFPLIFNAVQNKSPGAIDNATSVAILLEISKLLKIEPPKNLKVTFLITAAEETGLHGAADYMNRHSNELDPATTFFLNYDGVGSGKNSVLTAYGIPLKRTSKVLNKLIFEIVKEQQIEEGVGKFFLPIGAATDHIPVQREGFEITCLVSKMPRTHTSFDVVKHVKIESLKTAGVVGLELARKLDVKFKN